MPLKSVGLYKVMGEGVQAIVGGTYHQFVSTSNFLSIHTYFSILSGSFCSSSVIPPVNITESPYSWPMRPIMRMLSAERRWFVKVPREVLSEVGVKVDKRLCWWVGLEKHLSCIIDLINIFVKYADFCGLGVDPRPIITLVIPLFIRCFVSIIG